MRSRVRRSSLRGGSLSKSAASPTYIVISVGKTVSLAVPGLEAAGGTAYREVLPVDQSRKTRCAAAVRSRFMHDGRGQKRQCNTEEQHWVLRVQASSPHGGRFVRTCVYRVSCTISDHL